MGSLILGLVISGIALVVAQLPTGNAGAPGALLPEQVKLQSSIVNDRMHLFNGVLMYRTLNAVPVGDTRELDVTLLAIGQNPGETRIPAGNVMGSRSLRVGGVEGATLSVRGGGAQISPVGPTRGLIGQAGDTINWTWDITPGQPGEHTLELVVVTYQGTSDNPLSVVSPPVRITLDVTDTWPHRFNSLKGWIIGLGAFFAALTIILTFFREQVSGSLTKRASKEKGTVASDAGARKSSDSDASST